MSERAWTAGLARFFAAGSGVEVPIGDDAAVVRNRGPRSVLCVDPVVEGVHFTAEDNPSLVGRKAVNRNLSDLAAMGAVPDWLLVSLLLPHGTGAARRDALMRGIRAAARAGGAAVVGGDVSATRGPLVVTVTAVGHLRGRALERRAARTGDSIHVTGPLGGSRLGAHLRFRPHLAEGQWLATRVPKIGAAMDVSDGLLLDLATLLAASGGLGAELDAAAVPVSPAARRTARGDRARALRHALSDGEDHVLLFTLHRGGSLPPGGPLRAVARRPIGRVTREPGLWLRLPNGSRLPLAPEGWQHEV
ncbi:MAG: Thiamine-monophosphate kinase [Planctomycetota bacterium]|jgi:thiamine-monophosphate kinase